MTGSTSGIGFAIAQGLAAEGAQVVITGRSEPSVQDALARLRQALPQARVTGIAADRATAEGVERCSAVARGGHPGQQPRHLRAQARFEISDADWLRFFEVNVMSGVRLTRHYAPGMAKAGWGRVLFVSSESALNIPREMIHYGMTKTAQLSISHGMAMELAGTGVTVNALLPGPTRTANTEKMRAERAKAAGKTVAELEEEFFTVFRPTSLIKRFTSAEEVANLAVYLCSTRASATTGAALRVDGGVVNQIM